MATMTSAELDYVQSLGDVLRLTQERRLASIRNREAAQRLREERLGEPITKARMAELIELAITDSGLEEDSPEIRGARAGLAETEAIVELLERRGLVNTGSDRHD